MYANRYDLDETGTRSHKDRRMDQTKNVTTKLKSILEINNRIDIEKNEICDGDRFGNPHGIKQTKKMKIIRC